METDAPRVTDCTALGEASRRSRFCLGLAENVAFTPCLLFHGSTTRRPGRYRAALRPVGSPDRPFTRTADPK